MRRAGLARRRRGVRRLARATSVVAAGCGVLAALLTSPYVVANATGHSKQYTAAEGSGAFDTLDGFLFVIAGVCGALVLTALVGLAAGYADVPSANMLWAYSAVMGVLSLGVMVAIVLPWVAHPAEYADQQETVWGSGPAGLAATVAAALVAGGAAAAAAGAGWRHAKLAALSDADKEELAKLLAPPALRVRRETQALRPSDDPPSPLNSDVMLGGHRSGLVETAAIDIPGTGEVSRAAAASLSAASQADVITVDPLVARSWLR
ncbi:uncharacterized protein AMSG_03097 [Thecamonas trahens ATCC 50062]|uniref:Uncharacterized protein n=1 Tax=Thecamonas trahens ATCC 50062 TaxID=461836 RepID=A0A0L0D3A9_THETB|nr:hypothetical protein AMSG_03097 [Thecamonas trahens ATCC 50062]KNC46660.1 hypothetical protein AMSG_03097 [Thecamonas trahens ATCC 50062]|eukprot:XP_013760433.1 hypothetical protein AMSG_03097 [Thecamonas trahens ATCC 50062]